MNRRRAAPWMVLGLAGSLVAFAAWYQEKLSTAAFSGVFLLSMGSMMIGILTGIYSSAP